MNRGHPAAFSRSRNEIGARGVAWEPMIPATQDGTGTTGGFRRSGMNVVSDIGFPGLDRYRDGAEGEVDLSTELEGEIFELLQNVDQPSFGITAGFI
jgi:hypothetical protein